MAGGAALTAVLAAGACRLRYDPNLLNLQAQGLESVKWEMTLINHTRGASWHALSYTTTPEEALALKNRYARLPEVSMVVEVASLVPADQEYKLEMLREIRHRLAQDECLLSVRKSRCLHCCPLLPAGGIRAEKL